MKRIFVVGSLLLLTMSLLGQSDKIKALKTSLVRMSGEEYSRNALALSELYFAEGFYKNSAEWAEKAYAAAKDAKLDSYMARALNRQGKALILLPSSRNYHKSKAFDCFEESNKLKVDSTLKMDNLLNMQGLAVLLKKERDLREIRREIAVLRGEEPTQPQEEFRGSRRKIIEKAQEMQNKNLALSETLTSLSQEKEKLHLEQQHLQQLIKLKEGDIQNMSAEQARQELRLSMQERILDSMAFAGILDSLQIAQQQSDLDRAEAEIQLHHSQRNFLLVLVGLGLVLSAGLVYRYYTLRRHNAVLSEKNRIIEEERKRSEELLLNILPVAVANELKEKGAAEAKHYSEATVLFADFKGFSSISKLLPPEKLVTDLNYAFTNFDRIITAYGLEKIKTIGDAYMCAGGLPGKDSAHPVNVVKAALDIQQFLRAWNVEKKQLGEPAFEARIGIHTGPLVAGVVGYKKFAYDIWGDTVNVAARMESSGEVGKVNISDATFEQVKGNFNCAYRGKVPARNVGEVEMYYVEEAIS